MESQVSCTWPINKKSSFQFHCCAISRVFFGGFALVVAIPFNSTGKFLQFQLVFKVMLTFARVSIFTAFIQLMSHSKVRVRVEASVLVTDLFWRFFRKGVWKELFFLQFFVRQLDSWFNSLFTSVLLKSSELRNTQLQDFTIKFSKLSMLGCLAFT